MATLRRVFSGIQPSGSAHLGNYLGALRQWVKLQDSYNQVMYSLVDLHALTVPQAPFLLRKNIRDMTSCLLACGVDPERSILFQQSQVERAIMVLNPVKRPFDTQVPQHTELSWILSCRTPSGWLSRMTQWKAKGATDNRDVVNLGLFSYPVLMAADILLYRATDVPVGEDQVQHLELARDIARSFNASYQELFPLPQALMESGTVRRIMSLRDPFQKMSKSDNMEGSRINLNDSPDHIRKKMRKAVTDCTSEITFSPEKRPGVSNLISIYSAVTGLSPSEVTSQFVGKETVDFKDSLAEVLIEHLKPIQEKLTQYNANQEYVDDVLRKGSEKATEEACKTMAEIKTILGLQ